MFGVVKKWLFALIGKPVTDGKQSGDSAVEQEVQQPQEPQEDSVTNDIKMFKQFVRNSAGKARVLLTPYAKKSTESLTTTTKTVKGSVDNKFIKITVRAFIVVFFAIILIFITTYLFGRLKEGNGNITQNGRITPTPVSFDPDKPSIYAQDPEVLRLEEEINILKGELVGVSIRESGINPPSLDYEISF